MHRIKLQKDKILIIAKEIKQKFPNLKINLLIINNKIIIKSKNKLDLETKKNLEYIIKIHFPESILNFQIH